MTGASQGLGRAICVELATALSKTDRQCVFYLLARNSQGLKETATEITQGKSNLKGPLLASGFSECQMGFGPFFFLFLCLPVVEYPIDLGDVAKLEANLDGLFSQVQSCLPHSCNLSLNYHGLSLEYHWNTYYSNFSEFSLKLCRFR